MNNERPYDHSASMSDFEPRSFSALIPLLLLLWLPPTGKAFAASARWKANPVSTDWNTAANWMPRTVPNAPEDTASFGASRRTDVSLSQGVSVSAIAFDIDASAYTITNTVGLTIGGTGVVNESGRTQTIVAFSDGFNVANTAFVGAAHAGASVVWRNGGWMGFSDTATAGSAIIIITGPPNLASGGSANFFGSSNAGNATFVLKGGPVSSGGSIMFNDDSSAANGTFIVEGIGASGAGGGNLYFFNRSSAGNGSFTVDGNDFTNTDLFRGFVAFFGDSTANDAVLTANGSLVDGALGGVVEFAGAATADNATVIANGGSGGGLGGEIEFFEDATGGTARFQVWGNASLDISVHTAPSVTIGSIEGSGNVFLGAATLKTGSNGQSTTFSGVIADGGANGGAGGSLIKLGKGTLTLSGANTYTGRTVINNGSLLLKNKRGSATGTGPVRVNTGILSGPGKISGAVTIGNGASPRAILLPATAIKPSTLVINNSLTFNSLSHYQCILNRATSVASKVNALALTINNGAVFDLVDNTAGALTAGTVFTVIDNTSASPISGTFSNLADGSTFTSRGTTFKASYAGGSGNDLTLTVQ